MRVEGVVFDNDGLLLDTEIAWTRAEERLFGARGRRFTIEHKRSLIGSSHAQAELKLEAMLAMPDMGGQLMDELHELVMEEVAGGVPPRPGALELLARLQEAHVPLGVASNSRRDFVELTLAGAGLLDGGPFDVIVCADDVAKPKPDPDIYVHACARLGVEPVSSVAFEDSPVGAASAVAAGMYVIGVPYLAGTTLSGVHMHADSLADAVVARTLGLAA
jgi:HAD superfamily hydrolase (TIGR01509 family)